MPVNTTNTQETLNDQIKRLKSRIADTQQIINELETEHYHTKDQTDQLISQVMRRLENPRHMILALSGGANVDDPRLRQAREQSARDHRYIREIQADFDQHVLEFNEFKLDYERQIDLWAGEIEKLISDANEKLEE